MWLANAVTLAILSLVCLVQVGADLPSCYRARCSHCSVVFIAQMCPNTCASCYGTDPHRIPTGPRIRAGSASYRPIHLATGSTLLPSQPRIHGQPTSNTGPNHPSLSSQTSPRHGVFSSSNTNQDQDNHPASSPAKAPLAQSLPAAESPQQPQPIVQPQPQYQHQFNGPVQQISSNTGPQPLHTGSPQTPKLPHYPAAGSHPQVPAHPDQHASLGPQTQNSANVAQPAAFGTQTQVSSNLGQPTAYGSSYAPAAAVPPNQFSGNAQPNGQTSLNLGQPQAFGQNSQYYGQQPQAQQSITFFGQNQAQTQALPQQQGASQFGQGGQTQPFGQQQQGVAGQQPGNTPFANPFQPFLQQSYVAQQAQPQQQSMFQPFTVATPAPFINTPATVPQTFQRLPQAQQLLPQTQPGYAQQSQGNFRAQPAVNSPDQQALANSQYTYGPVTDSQRPRQIYNNGPASNLPAPQEPLLATLPPSQPVAPALPAKQPNRFAAVPTAVVTASNSIDPTAVYVNKNGYAEKSGAIAGGAFPQPSTCSKHPNWEPCITKEIANQRFSNCCQRLGDGCSQLCSYDQTLTVLQLAVLTGRCPIGKVADMMICASGYEDATSCCQAHNVFEMGYEHCRPYCNPAAGLPNDGMLAEKYRCLGKLSQIQRNMDAMKQEIMEQLANGLSSVRCDLTVGDVL